MVAHLIPVDDPGRGWQDWASDPAIGAYQSWSGYDYLLSDDDRGAVCYLLNTSGGAPIRNGVSGLANCPAHQAALDALSTAWGVSSPTWPPETDVFSPGQEVELVVVTKALGTGAPDATVEMQWGSGWIVWENDQFTSTDPNNPASFSVPMALTRYDHVLAGGVLTTTVRGRVIDAYDGLNHLWVRLQPVNAYGDTTGFGVEGYQLLVDEAYVRSLGAPVSGAHRSQSVSFERGGR